MTLPYRRTSQALVPAVVVAGAGLLSVLLAVTTHPGNGPVGDGGGRPPARERDASPLTSGVDPQRVVPPAPIDRFRCPAATVTVSTARQLKAALADAGPGTVIRLRDGDYPGTFTARTSGTATAPVHLCGSRRAVLRGPSISTGYGLHLDHVAHWRVSGFSVRRAQKGVVLDASTDVGLQDLLVEHIGDEGVHLRTDSSRDVLRGLTVRDVGLLDPAFGEGVYIGSARTNWGSVTGGAPDRSDGNHLLESTISRTTAESVDVKEGTTAGVIQGNVFDGAGMTAATAWVNVKGNAWVIAGNRGVNSPRDGFQTHEILDAWGVGNLFRDNRAELAAGGDGVGIRVRSLPNVVSCSNTTTGGRPVSNVGCTPPA